METAVSASLNLGVAHSAYVIQAEGMKNPVAFGLYFFYPFEANERKKGSKMFNYILFEKQKSLSNNIN